MIRRALFFAFVHFLLNVGLCAQETPGVQPLLRAGVAKSDITTTADGARINDPLYAKALVMDDGTTKLVIIAMDVTAIGGIGEVGDGFLPALRSRIESELGIPASHVLVNASHNHPPVQMLCSPEDQLARTFDAVRRAHDTMREAKVGAAAGHEDRISMNRTLRLKNGRAWTIRHTNPCPPDAEVEGVGPIDPEIGVMRIDRADGHPIAVLYNFACHPYLTVPRGGVTADFPGFASAVIEETLGEGALALFIQGAGGDITDVHYKDVNRPRDAEPLGTMLGLSTLKAWRTITPSPAKLQVISEKLDLPRKNDFERKIAALQEEQAALLRNLRGTSLNFETFLPLYIKYTHDPDTPSNYSYKYLQSAALGTDEFGEIDAQNRAHMDKYMRNIRSMEILASIEDDIATLRRHQAINERSGETTITTEILGVRIGEFVFISSPAEVLVQIGLNVKAASPFEHTYMAAYSNGYIHYGPPASEYEKGGYEVTECLLAPEWQAVYEAKAAEVLERLR
ncbi:MAG: hypothetical protein AMXMBFR84_41650 [Candidatus Hydrogenedentota bacterium]